MVVSGRGEEDSAGEGEEMSARTTVFCIGLGAGALSHILVFGSLGGPFFVWLFIGQSVSNGLLAVGLVGILRRRQELKARSEWLNRQWTPPYAPEFAPLNFQSRPALDELSVEGVAARRAAIERMAARDNTEFIPDLLAHRCKACSTIYVQWHDAFECHKLKTY